MSAIRTFRTLLNVNRNPDDLSEFSINSRAQLVWLHGKAEQYSDRNLAGEVEKLDRKLVDLLVPMLADAPLVVVGYRGAEPSIMDQLLTKSFKRTHNFRNGIYWCIRAGEALHPNVKALRRALGGNFKLLEITGFDELMIDLAHELSSEDLYPNAAKAEESKRELAFDDRPLFGSSIDELDHDQMLTVMVDYCQKLGRAPVTRETLRGLLREQGFLIDVDGTEIPTAGCMLLFGKNPQKYFPQAAVSATISGKKRTLFTGNLLCQRVELLEWLSGEDVNPLLKVKRGSKHEKVHAYPARGLVELLVNMLVHRDYQSGETASIDVEPGHSITLRNPGGLLDSVARRVELDEGGRFRAVPNVSDLRNRSLCDVFFGIQAMEREGTGLSDVETLAREHGGDASFTHDAKSAAFIASVLQPVASVGSKTTARNDQPTGIYVLNVLPFLSLPETVSIVRLTTPISSRPAGVALADAGTFIIRSEELELWSFVPLPILTGLLGPIVDQATSREAPRRNVEADPDQRRVLSWLLRKHFERHLARFQPLGLILEESRKKKRAYFEGREGRPRKLIYDTPRRKGIGREVVKQRGEAPRAWFENEGFGYEVTQVDSVWAVRIKPFYMFTGRDAKKPLPAFARTSRATRRIKLDRNKNVEDDLTFWARFLSGGGPTINIGQDHVTDLIVEGQFLAVEVAEQGLLRESDEGADRVLA